MLNGFDLPQIDFSSVPKSKLLALAASAGLVIFLGGLVVRERLGSGKGITKGSATSDVLVPTIVNGELVLPKVATGGDPGSNLGKAMTGRLGVLSANLVGVFDPQSQKLSAIRILGEAQNISGSVVDGISPVITFFDGDSKVVGKKIARLSQGFDFFSLQPSESTLYDVTVDSPPTSDKLEVVLNAASATTSAVFEPLKIASRSVEVKTATYQGGNSPQGSSSGQATSSGQEKIEYYTVSGGVLNQLSDPVSDISIYAWIRDVSGKVFSFGRQDFKNDLLSPSSKIDFRINLIPLKSRENYDSYEVAAWGKRYKFNL